MLIHVLDMDHLPQTSFPSSQLSLPPVAVGPLCLTLGTGSLGGGTCDGGGQGTALPWLHSGSEQGWEEGFTWPTYGQRL